MIYTQKEILRIWVSRTSSSPSLPQTAVCKPKPPAWSLAPMQIERSYAAPFPSSHGGQRKYQSGHLSTTPRSSGKITHNTKKREKKLHNGHCQMPLTCYQQKPIPLHDNRAAFLCMTKHSGAICSQCVAWVRAARMSEKFVAHFRVSHLYCRCFHLHSSVLLCVSHTIAFAIS